MELNVSTSHWIGRGLGAANALVFWGSLGLAAPGTIAARTGIRTGLRQGARALMKASEWLEGAGKSSSRGVIGRLSRVLGRSLGRDILATAATILTDIDAGMAEADHYLTFGIHNAAAAAIEGTITHGFETALKIPGTTLAQKLHEASNRTALKYVLTADPKGLVAYVKDGPRAHDSTLEGSLAVSAQLGTGTSRRTGRRLGLALFQPQQLAKGGQAAAVQAAGTAMRAPRAAAQAVGQAAGKVVTAPVRAPARAAAWTATRVRRGVAKVRRTREATVATARTAATTTQRAARFVRQTPQRPLRQTVTGLGQATRATGRLATAAGYRAVLGAARVAVPVGQATFTMLKMATSVAAFGASAGMLANRLQPATIGADFQRLEGRRQENSEREQGPASSRSLAGRLGLKAKQAERQSADRVAYEKTQAGRQGKQSKRNEGGIGR